MRRSTFLSGCAGTLLCAVPALTLGEPRVGVLGLGPAPSADAQALSAAIGDTTFIDVTAADLCRQTAAVDVLWWHAVESAKVPEVLADPAQVECLRAFVRKGGGLVLSGFAPQYAVPLGLQTAPPTSIISDPGISGNWGFTPRCGTGLFEGMGSPAITLDGGNRTRNILCWWDNPLDFSGEWLADSESRPGKVAMGEWRLGSGRVLFIGSGAFTMEPEVAPNRNRSLLIERVVAEVDKPVSAPLEGEETLAANWPLDGSAVESISGTTDRIHNNFGKPEFVKGADGTVALRCDGFSTWIERDAACAPFLGRNFTISASVAVANYPVQDAPFVAQLNGHAGWGMVLNRYGQWGVRVMLDGVWHAVWSPAPIAVGHWKHLAARYDSGTGTLALYEDGVEVARTTTLLGARVTMAADAPLMIGKASDSGTVAEIFPTAVYNGLIADVRVHRDALPTERLAQAAERLKARGPADLSIPESRFAADPHRPIYHLLPAANWTNEPHGFVQDRDGLYHLFHQANPSGPYWASIQWGHMTSKDLVHWQLEPIALAPAPGIDREGIWSGDAVIDDEGRVTLLYTAIDGVKAAICLAYPDAAGAFRRWEGSPAIAGRPAGENLMDFRDPCLYREGNGPWHMIIGAGIPEVGGTALHYTSNDLRKWDYKGHFHSGNKATSGIFWEMPLLLDLGGKYFFGVTEMPGRNSYWLGSFDGEKFTPESPDPTPLEIINHYLSPTVVKEPGGREVAIGIIPETRSSKAQLAAGWAHCYGIPRVWGLDAKGRLTQVPAPELESLRTDPRQAHGIAVAASPMIIGDGFQGDTGELHLEFAPQQSGTVTIELRRSPDGAELTTLQYDFATGEVVLDRAKSSLDAEAVRDRRTGRFVLDPGEPLKLRLFIDRSVIEAFFNGRGTLTTRVYPTRSDATEIRVSAGQGTTITEARFWKLQSIWKRP